jgi:hypothetical protein
MRAGKKIMKDSESYVTIHVNTNAAIGTAREWTPCIIGDGSNKKTAGGKAQEIMKDGKIYKNTGQ